MGTDLREKDAVRQSGRRGSLLIVAVIAVAVVATLAVAAGIYLRSQAAAVEASHRLRLLRGEAGNAAARAVADLLAGDTNGWDALSEPWAAEPWEVRERGWILRASGNGWSPVPGETVGLIDAERSIPLLRADATLLGAVFATVMGIPADEAAERALAVVAWREAAVTNAGVDAAALLLLPEQLGALPGFEPETLARLRPHLTTVGSGKVNLNTAPAPVLEAVLAAASAGDRAAAAELLDRLLAHRAEGHFFTAADPTSVGRALIGLPTDQAALLARAEPLLAAESTAFSGVAEALRPQEQGRPGRVTFTWSREEREFVRWTEE